MICIRNTRPWRSVIACTTPVRRCNRISSSRSSAGKNPDADTETKSDAVDHYQIRADDKELPSTNVGRTKEEASDTSSGQFWQQDTSTINWWKKSAIPFEGNQTREVTVQYNARYAENDESVSDDSHISDATFAYSLSPASTWKGPLGKGKIEINILHPEPEDVSIEKPKPPLGESTKRYSFRAPASSAQLLRSTGFRAMGLANNHALDFGFAALHDCATRLIQGKSSPWELQNAEAILATRAFSQCLMVRKLRCLQSVIVGPAAGSQIGSASDRIRVSNAIADARSDADVVVCMIHWGIENSEKITDQQRELARWLIERGVDVVVGSHPHCVQPLDFYHGCPIAYSLGNLVLDGAPSVVSWNRGAILETGLNENAQPTAVCLVPLILEGGFPRVDEADQFG